ncbi:adenosylcobinamide-phosphate synthase CbiB [Capilliphycus salinus ALCB114379]|uniref:adenosylcobinamide-phosphate synthase CbiB n=1 Tax=Capilliphycus salinus TaxID=2768948 RepID=UPI0039A63931
MIDSSSIVTLVIAAWLDFLIGDPWGWLHPVQVMGWAIGRYTRLAFAWFKTPQSLKVSGILLAILLIFGSGFTSWLILQAVKSIPLQFPLHPILDIGVESIMLASCFALRSLRQAAEDVLHPLNNGNLSLARQQLSLYVGRDTQDLSESEVLRAVLETVAENSTDGVIAPLFYALVGMAIPGIGSVPFAFAYKAASTLDSMVGYKEAPLTDIGWFSAKLEDILTWLPCRLNTLLIALVSGKPKFVWTICQRDAIYDPSPNAGWSECAYAATLGVQLGGVNKYKGVIKHKPLLGDFISPISPAIVRQGLQLTRQTFLMVLGLFLFVYGAIGLIVNRL